MLIVNPNNRITQVKPDLPAIEPPLWAGLIASYHNADILDAEALDMKLWEVEEWIRRQRHKDVLICVMGSNPSVSSTPKMPVAEALADRIKDLNVSFTGLHPIAVNYDKYPLVRTPFQGFPMQPWDKLPMQRYRAHNWQCLDGSSRKGYASIYTSLGCPFSCPYCNIHTLYGDRKVRFRPTKDVIKEFTTVASLGVRNVKIWDELFALDQHRVSTICRAIEGLNLNIWAYARLDSVTPNMLSTMKRGGINWLAYGFESVTDRKFVEEVEEVIKMTKDAGIAIIANFMFGLPGTTLDDDKASLDFAMNHLFEFVNLYDARPYPGSQWHEEAKSEWGDKKNPLDRQSLFFDQYAIQSEFRKYAFKTYFSNPDYLSMLKAKWGDQAVRQIQEMLAWQK